MNNKSTTDSDLPDYSEQDIYFVQLIDEQGKTQLEAFKLAYPEKEWIDTTIRPYACRLYNSDKIKQIRTMIADGIKERAARTREERIGALERLAIMAEANGQYNSAIRAQELAGKLEGHYVEKHESIKRNESVEDALRKVQEQYGDKLMLEIATTRGVPHIAKKILNSESVH
jgi:hypothetical protein